MFKQWFAPVLVLLVVLVAFCSAAQAENWPGFRGPSFNGSSSEKNLPVFFSRTENLLWTADLPGPGSATPVIWDDRVFISSTDMKNESIKAMCFSRLDGKLLWEHVVGEGVKQDYRSTYAAPSPVTDGETVIFFYGNGDLYAYDLQGKQKWKKNIGPFAFLWTFSTSPLLYDGRLYLQVLQRDTAVQGRGKKSGNESYLLALNPATGEELWRQVRPSQAQAESLEAFSTPVPVEIGGVKQIVIAGGDALTGHAADTGKELWRWGTWNPTRIPHWRLVPSPVAGEGIVLACAPKRDPIYAIKAEGKGKLSDKAVAWISEKKSVISSDVPTPAYYDGDFFVLSDVRKALSRVEPTTGKVKWTIQTPGRSKYEASPTAADGKVYIVNFDGDVSVVNAEDGKILRTVSMDDRNEESVRASIAISSGKLFIRCKRKLYCVSGSAE